MILLSFACFVSSFTIICKLIKFCLISVTAGKEWGWKEFAVGMGIGMEVREMTELKLCVNFTAALIT